MNSGKIVLKKRTVNHFQAILREANIISVFPVKEFSAHTMVRGNVRRMLARRLRTGMRLPCAWEVMLVHVGHSAAARQNCWCIPQAAVCNLSLGAIIPRTIFICCQNEGESRTSMYRKIQFVTD